MLVTSLGESASASARAVHASGDFARSHVPSEALVLVQVDERASAAIFLESEVGVELAEERAVVAVGSEPNAPILGSGSGDDLMRPPDACGRTRVPWGPFSTSTRSTLLKLKMLP
jgi:hypothetical protein